MGVSLPFRILMPACLLLTVGGILGTPLHAVAQQHAHPHESRHEYRREIDQMEDAWRTAMLKSNTAVLDTLLADDYTGITAKGAIQTKEQALSNMRAGGLQIASLSISDRKVRIYGATAVVTSVAEMAGSRNAQEISGRYRYTRVYVRNPLGKWKIVSFEASRIQEGNEHK